MKKRKYKEEAKGRGGKVQPTKGEYLQECPDLGLLPSAPMEGCVAQMRGQPAQVLVLAQSSVSWTRVSKLTAPSSHFAMHGFIHTLSKLLLNTHLSCTAEISSSKNVLPAI